ncbi:MAG: dihydropteroate synthase [Myxococcota bacterium]
MRLGARELDLSRPLLVGILNVTPDSFSDGGNLPDLEAVLRRAEAMVRDGADLLDLGGESTRPGAHPVSVQVELDRVLPAVEALRARLDVPLSVDTRRAAVAEPALRLGATMINDVSGFGDPDMGRVVANAGAAWVLMHMPHAMGQMGASLRSEGMPEGVYEGLERITADLAEVVDRAVTAGVERGQLALDPGIGFGKTLGQNLALLRGAGSLVRLGLPVYLGPSRKSFIGAICGAPTDDRLMGTAAAVTAGALAGAAFLRVHDVRQMRQVLDVAIALRDAI